MIGKKFMNVVTGDESLIHFFKLPKKFSNRRCQKDLHCQKDCKSEKSLCMPYFKLLKA